MSLARLFQRPHYTSNATDFIETLKKDKPELEQSQRDGRDRLWDRHISADLQSDYQAGRVRQTGYVYYEYAADKKRRQA